MIKDKTKRFGSQGDMKEIMEHPWFAGMNWDKLQNKNVNFTVVEYTVHSLKFKVCLNNCKLVEVCFFCEIESKMLLIDANKIPINPNIMAIPPNINATGYPMKRKIAKTKNI